VYARERNHDPRLAHDEPLADAVDAGVSFIERAVRYHLDVGEGPGSVHHMVALRERAARQRTQEDVEGIVRQFVEGDVSRLVPEVGMNVVGATPYAEEPGETAAVEGRITRTLSGINPNRGVRFGASSHVARFCCRPASSTHRFGSLSTVGSTTRLRTRSAYLTDRPLNSTDRTTEPEPDVEGSTMGWVAHRAFERADGTPAAVYDRGDLGKEAITRLLAPDPETAIDQALALAEVIGGG